MQNFGYTFRKRTKTTQCNRSLWQNIGNPCVHCAAPAVWENQTTSVLKRPKSRGFVKLSLIGTGASRLFKKITGCASTTY